MFCQKEVTAITLPPILLPPPLHKKRRGLRAATRSRLRLCRLRRWHSAAPPGLEGTTAGAPPGVWRPPIRCFSGCFLQQLLTRAAWLDSNWRENTSLPLGLSSNFSLSDPSEKEFDRKDTQRLGIVPEFCWEGRWVNGCLGSCFSKHFLFCLVFPEGNCRFSSTVFFFSASAQCFLPPEGLNIYHLSERLRGFEL